MVYVQNFDGFLNEEINWGKQPWKFVKDTMKLEEPEDESEESEPDEEGRSKISKRELKKLIRAEKKKADVKKSYIAPDAQVSLKFKFRPSIFHIVNIPELHNALTKLARKNNLDGTVSCVGDKFEFDLEGKKKDADAFYEKLREIIYH
jgi:hypothetical protein